MAQLVLVLDFGGQYKELIARNVRSLNVYSEIHSGTRLTAADIQKMSPIGIILTGGPKSVYGEGAPLCDPGIFALGIPVLGICYGMHLMCHTLGGLVEPGEAEYGAVNTRVLGGTLFRDIAGEIPALMSHGDCVARLPEGFGKIAETDNCPVAAMESDARRLYATQFHPETTHTRQGRDILRNFLFDICRAAGDYRLDDYIETACAAVRAKVGDGRVLLALSGGVDSSVCAALLSRAVPDRLTCVFVDHGFMRLDEGDEIERIFAKRRLRFVRVNAARRFLKAVGGVSDPEAKRKIIGAEFARVFEEEAAKLGGGHYLAQGTIYPDVIESGGEHAAVIKSHHNVGGLPADLDFAGLVEPLNGLFKDEVRALGRKLGLPARLVNRPPFPGPGLAIRILGAVSKPKLETLRAADAIVRAEFARHRVKSDQYFAVLPNVRTVGVMGDGRTYDQVVAIRAVNTSDFMTCSYTPVPHSVLSAIAARIVNEVPGVSRVVYDITNKPPATVEWE